MRLKDEDGQAIVLVALAMSIFLIGAIGLAVDGSNLYTQRQFAQAAADAAAQAGMMSIFDGTNTITGNAAAFTAGTAFTCTTTDKRTPCVFASDNGFGGSSTDTVAVTFPADTAFPGVAFSSDPVNLITVSVSRQVNTTLMRLLGPTVTTVTATATAAIVSVVAPTPILVTHPSLAGALTISREPPSSPSAVGQAEASRSTQAARLPTVAGVLSICRTRVRRIRVSARPARERILLSLGALLQIRGRCNSEPRATTFRGRIPIQDPFANVVAPSSSGMPTGTSKSITAPTDGCVSGTCTEYSPGIYPKLDLTKQNVIFKPGIYYIQGTQGLTLKQTTGGGANNSSMCVGCAADANTGTGMLIYDTGPSGSTLNHNPAGGFNAGTQNSIEIQGPTLTTTNSQGQTVPAKPYYDIAFWEDRTADSNQNHQIGQGNGCFQVIGTVYITNTQAIMAADPTHYQGVSYGGTPCSTTITQGDIIVGTLELNGTAGITMNLVPFGFLSIRQVAMVN